MSYRKIWFIISLLLVMFVFVSSYAAANALETMEENLQVSIADIIIITVTMGVIVICAVDVRIAIMCAFLLYASVFIVFTLATEEGYTGFNPYISGVAMMVCFVILCLMLLLTYKRLNTPVGVV